MIMNRPRSAQDLRDCHRTRRKRTGRHNRHYLSLRRTQRHIRASCQRSLKSERARPRSNGCIRRRGRSQQHTVSDRRPGIVRRDAGRERIKRLCEQHRRAQRPHIRANAHSLRRNIRCERRRRRQPVCHSLTSDVVRRRKLKLEHLAESARRHLRPARRRRCRAAIRIVHHGIKILLSIIELEIDERLGRRSSPTTTAPQRHRSTSNRHVSHSKRSRRCRQSAHVALRNIKHVSARRRTRRRLRQILPPARLRQIKCLERLVPGTTGKTGWGDIVC